MDRLLCGVFVLLLGLVSASLAVSLQGVSPPKNWRLISLPDGVLAEPREFLFALNQRNMDQLEKSLLQVSDPSHPNYGRYLSQHQIADLIGLTNPQVEKFTKWAQDEGLTVLKIGGTRDFATVSATPKQMERIFGTFSQHSLTLLLTSQKKKKKKGFHFQAYVEKNTGHSVLRTQESYQIPSAIANIVDFVVGIHGFPNVVSVLFVYCHDLEINFQKKKQSRVQGRQDSVIYPKDVLKKYNVPEPTKPTTNSSQAVVELQMNWFSTSDLTQFFKTYLPSLGGQHVLDVYGYNDGDTDSPR